jgi:DNA-binding NarL/FixJ family response regulator
VKKLRKILIVDDHPIVRQGVKSLLAHEEDLLISAEAESAGEAISIMREGAIDLVIIDISLKGTDGLELTKMIRAEFASLPILIMSMHDESLYAERAIRSGANGYIMKQEMADNIITAIRRVLSRRIYTSEAIRDTLLGRFAAGSADTTLTPVDRLSDRELEVFRLIGEGLSTRDVATRLHLSVKTIETHRSHIKQKLNVDTAVELVRQAVHFVEHGTTKPP